MTDYTKTTGNEKADAWLGFIALFGLVGFIGYCTMQSTSPEAEARRDAYAAELKAEEDRDAIRRQNDRIACAAGVAKACDAIEQRLK